MTIPLLSTGQDNRLLNVKAVVWIRRSAIAFEQEDLNVTRNPLPTPGESCGSSTRRVPLRSEVLGLGQATPIQPVSY